MRTCAYMNASVSVCKGEKECMCVHVCSLLREHDLIVQSSFTNVSESVAVSFSTSIYEALELHEMSHGIHRS